MSTTTSPKSEPFVTLATRIPKSLHHRLQIAAVETGTHQQAIVEAALRARLAAHKGGRGRVKKAS